MKNCFLFPGQGAQYPGMGRDLYEESAEIKALFQLGSDMTGIDLKKLIFEGTEEELKATDKTQASITLVNLSAAKLLSGRGITPAGTAGFSLGEYSALTTAGILSAEDCFKLVKLRGEYMQEACNNAGPSGMAAVVSRKPEAIATIIESLNNTPQEGLYVANYNSPLQVVLSGTDEALVKAEEFCKEAGARRYLRLMVAGPFHSPILQDAADRFKESLTGVTFNNPAIPVFSNVTGKAIETGDEAKELAVAQITSSVRWTEEEQTITAAGFDRTLEVGPGKVLTGLWSAIGSDIPCITAGTAEQINAVDA